MNAVDELVDVMKEGGGVRGLADHLKLDIDSADKGKVGLAALSKGCEGKHQEHGCKVELHVGWEPVVSVWRL